MLRYININYESAFFEKLKDTFSPKIISDEN